jgi:hypothetical protein
MDVRPRLAQVRRSTFWTLAAVSAAIGILAGAWSVAEPNYVEFTTDQRCITYPTPSGDPPLVSCSKVPEYTAEIEVPPNLSDIGVGMLAAGISYAALVIAVLSKRALDRPA